MQEKIHVIIRFRPSNKREKKEEKKRNLDNNSKQIVFQNNDERGIGAIEIYGRKSNEPKRFTFDRILDDDTSQEETFTHVSQHVCNDVISGYNGCIFAYGQTGSGKTYTMFGPENNESNPQLMGIIPRSVSYILSEIENDENILESRINVSFIEIYKEKLRDLLNPSSKKKLQIRLNKNNETYITNMTETTVYTLPDVLKLINVANLYRTKAETSMNASSSRSHMVMILNTYTKVKDGSIRAGKANFCDLAGSEKVRKTNAKGNTLKEAQKINLSLTILGQVISALGAKDTKHIPYRDSKLTHVLKDSLGGNCKTTLIVNASKHIFNRDETLISLRFGSRCKLITNKVKMNKIYGKKELMHIIDELKKANNELKIELKNERTASMMDFDPEPVGMRNESISLSEPWDPNANRIFAKKDAEKIKKLKNEVQDYKEGNERLMQQNNKLEHKKNKLQKNMDEMNRKMAGLNKKNKELLLEIEALAQINKEFEMGLYKMKRDESQNAKETSISLQNYDEQLKKAQLQMNDNGIEMKELKEELMDKKNEIRSKNDEISFKNHEIEGLKQDLEEMKNKLQNTIEIMEFERELKLAQESVEIYEEMAQPSVNEIVKAATTMFDGIDEQPSMLLRDESILDEVAYLQKVETRRITKRNTQLIPFNVQNMIIEEDKQVEADDYDDYMAEKINLESEIKEKEEHLDSLRLMPLSKDPSQRMTLLIDIAIAEDDIAVIKSKLQDIDAKLGKNKMSDDDDVMVAEYQDIVYGNKQPMMQLKNEKSVEFVENVGLDFGETIYGDFAAVEVTAELLKELEVKLKKGLKLKERKKLMKSYENCFVGKDAVTFMMNNGICQTREHAVMLGNRLQSNGVIQHITNDYDFKDDKKLYQFVDIDENMNGIYSFVFKHKPLAVSFGTNRKNKKNLYIVGIEPHSSAIGNVYLDSQIVKFENEYVENLGGRQIAKIFAKKYADKIPIKITFRKAQQKKKGKKKPK